MVKSLNSSADLASGDVKVIDTFEPAGVLVDASLLFSAEFIRLGDDLLLRGPDGGQILLRDYFAQDPPPQLQTAEGARLTAETVEALAVPEAPQAYAQTGDPQYGQPIGEVSDLNGIARVQRPDGTRDDLKEGDPIFQGDVVSTGVGSELGILFVDDTVFSLSANARMVINELIYNPSSTVNSMGVSLIQGTFVFITGQIAPNGEIEVDTPVGTIGIRGTTVGVQIATFGGFTRISNLTNPDTGETGSFTFSNNIADALFSLSNHYLEVRSANADPGLPAVISGQDISEAFGRALNTALQIQRNPNRTIEPQNDTDEQQGENQPTLEELQALLAEQPIIETASGPAVLSGGSSFAANLTLTGSNGAGFGGGLSGLTPTGTLGYLSVPGFGLLNIDSSSLPPNTPISLSSDPLEVAEGNLVQISVASLGVSGATAGTVFNVVSVSNGTVVFIAPGAAPVPVTSFTLQQLQNGQIFFAHDGSETTQASFAVTAGSSGIVIVPIEVDPVNDAPVLVNNSLTVAGGATVVLSEANLSASDPDTSPSDLVFTISGAAAEQFLLATSFGPAASFAAAAGGTIGGRFELAGNPGVAVTSFTQQQVIDGEVIFVDDGDSMPPSYGVSVSDGEFSTEPSTVSVSFVGTPFVIVELPGADDSVAENSTTADEANLVNLVVVPQGDDDLTEIVISGLQPDWTYDLSGLDTDGAGGAVTIIDNIAGDGTVTITFTPGTNTVYSGSLAIEPPADSDADHPQIQVTATAVDPTNTQLTTTGQGILNIAVDAVLDEALEFGPDGVAGGSEQVTSQTIALGLDVAVVRPFAGSGDGGADGDGSETTLVTLTLDAALPAGAVLSSTAGTVTPTGDPLVFTVTGTSLEDAIEGLQVQVPGGFEGLLSGRVSTTSREANTPPSSTAPASGAEPDTTNNTSSDTVAFTVTVTGGGVIPTASIALAGEAAAIKEDSEDNVVEFTANAGDATDELTTVVIKLPGVATGDVDGISFGADAAKVASTSISQVGADTVITITLNPGVESLSGSFTLDAPVADSDVDIAGVTITASAQDKTDNAETGQGGETTDIVVDAVLDQALELGADGITGGSEAVAAQTIGLGLDSSVVSAGFALSLAGGADGDSSESTSVTLTLDGPLPAGAVLESTDGVVSATGNPLVYTVTGASPEAAIDGLQVQVPGGFAGVISGTVSSTSFEADTPPDSTQPASGAEPDISDNTSGDSVAFTVTVTESVPFAVDDEATAPAESVARPQNIAIFIDRSGSISDADFEQELNAVRSFVQTLINEGSPESLAFSIVAFNAGAVDYGTYLYDGTGSGLGDFARIGASGNLDSLLTPGSGISNPAGNTSFNKALETLFENQNFLDNAVTQTPEHADRLFILSDGKVTAGGNTITPANLENLQDNDIEVVPVAIGTSVQASDFVDFFGSTVVPDTSAVLTDSGFTLLAETLIDTLVGDAVATGNLLDNDEAGADAFDTSNAVSQILHDSVIYNDASDGTIDGVIEISATAGGGSLRVISATGDFEYFIDSPETAFSEEFVYTLLDGDGDSDTATLVVNVELPTEVLPSLAAAGFVAASETFDTEESVSSSDQADTFIFSGNQLGGDLDVVTDYVPGENDVLDISDLVSFTDGLDDVEAFVTAVADGNGTTLAVSPDGVAPFTPLAFLDGVHQDDSLAVILDATEQSINVT